MTTDTSTETSASRLSGRRIFAYALSAFPLSALGLPLGVYVPPLYAEHTTLAVGFVGTLFFASRIFDVFTDPTFGLIADNMRPRIGRRKFWMLISIPILMGAVWMLFHPPAEAGAMYLVFWLSVVYIGYTMAFISHLAWGAELSGHYDDRSRVLGWREVGVTSGMLTVLILPVFLEQSAGDDAALARAHLMSLFVISILPVAFLTTAFLVPDPLPDDQHAPPARRLVDDLAAIARNIHMPRVVFADLALTTAIGITASLYVWLATHSLRMPESTSLILLAYFSAAVVSVPVWMRLAVRYEKHTVFSIAMFYGATTLFTYLFLPGLQLIWALISTVLYGCAYGAGLFLGRAMVADIADADELTTGQKRMGVFFSGLTLTNKVGFALGPLIAYNILDYVGFDPNGTATDAQANWLLGVFVIVPCFFLCLGGIIIQSHKLTRAEHKKIRAGLEARAAKS